MIRVALEAGEKRVFARAVDWPGWSRGGRTEADAIAALAAYAGRYRRAIGDASIPATVAASDLEVVERAGGGSGTDFGVPSASIDADAEPVSETELARLERVLDRAWRAFDRAVDGARGVELRKGPRGGGRDVPKIVAHVAEAEAAYITQLGGRPPKEADPAALRARAREVLRARVADDDVPNASGTKKRWRPRYYVHRSAWHLLDHAWEIEDRTER